MVDAGIHVGKTVAEKYQIIELIGTGGMASVWLARDIRLEKLWAIKEIKPNTLGSAGEVFRKALIDEAHLMKRLDHPLIPRVVDILDTGETTFVVMDYVEGRSLADVMRMRNRPFDQASVISWGIQLCDVLGYLHSLGKGVVYRDMKPGNVVVREDGSVRLIDFGVALDGDRGDGRHARLAGTPGYAAPEQLIADGAVDGRADVYALGATLYTLVTGHVPKLLGGGPTPDVSFEMKPIRVWIPELSEGLERIILRATSTRPDDRYESMDAMRYDLEHHEQLTERWRRVQLKKVAAVKRRALGACACALVGMACLVGSHTVRMSSYANIMREAHSAARAENDEGPSEAERLVSRALELDGTSLEPYQLLLAIYEDDYVLSSAEARRLQRVFGKAVALEREPGYARLCFDVGICYMSYYGVNMQGGSVGNASVASMRAAAPWFERAVAASASDYERAGLSEADARAAHIYKTISGFFDEASRAEREGRAAEDVYTAFWDALSRCLERENAAPASQKSTEGVRMRLCQVATQVLASPTYLGGMARAGVPEQDARGLSDQAQTCMRDLALFLSSDERSPAFGPVADEVEANLDLCASNIQAVYANPVFKDRQEGTSS